MTPLDSLIHERRSIRTYTDKPVADDTIKEMISAAAVTASPFHSQPVRFIRIVSEDTRKALEGQMQKQYTEYIQRIESVSVNKRVRNQVKVYYRYSKIMFSAPVLLAVGTINYTGFSQKLFQAQVTDSDIRNRADLDITAGLAIQNYLLKGEELGVQSCVLTAPLCFIHDIESIMGLKDISVTALIISGYAAENPAPLERNSFDTIYSEV